MSKEFDYSKLRHITSVDQSDRKVPYNLRQSGPTKLELLISTIEPITSIRFNSQKNVFRSRKSLEVNSPTSFTHAI